MNTGGVPLQHQTNWNLENLKGAILLGSQAIKSLELVNGAAAVGVLTFYGNYAAKGGTGIDPRFLKWGLVAFAIGVAFAILTAICGYLSQLIAAVFPPPNAEGHWRVGALVAGVCSAFCFVGGVVFVALAF